MNTFKAFYDIEYYPGITAGVQASSHEEALRALEAAWDAAYYYDEQWSYDQIPMTEDPVDFKYDLCPQKGDDLVVEVDIYVVCLETGLTKRFKGSKRVTSAQINARERKWEMELEEERRQKEERAEILEHKTDAIHEVYGRKVEFE